MAVGCRSLSLDLPEVSSKEAFTSHCVKFGSAFVIIYFMKLVFVMVLTL